MPPFTYENCTEKCFCLAHLSGVGSETEKRPKNITEFPLNVFLKWLVTVIRMASGWQERKCEIKIVNTVEGNVKILPGAQ